MSLNKYFTSFLVTAVILTGCVSSGIRVPQNTSEYAHTSAMIVLENKRSGGSGVIVKSSPRGSWILTNNHICNLIQGGGLVVTDQGEYPVHSYQSYKRHDLCLIKVLADLHQNNVLAEKAPELYEQTIIAGHPALYPTMVTRGHFTSDMTIQVMVDVKECDGTEESQEDVFMCAFMGKKPIIKTYSATPTTATIMPGSSGSGVFNSKGEVVALVFAGQGDLGYGLLVPYTYLKDFMTHLGSVPVEYPDKDRERKSLFSDVLKMEKFCNINKDKCKGITTSAIYID